MIATSEPAVERQITCADATAAKRQIEMKQNGG
jgi:hypothetical protein